MNHKALTLLGFAQRAGKIVSGETGCVASIKQRKTFLVILAEDASDNTKNQIKPLCQIYGIQCLEWGSKIDIGNSIGKSPRAVIGILEKSFADAIRKTKV
ncbi:MAG: L7Ae/L30e/S12e/Gadd45 family ribosomal protein [Bacillota bacterium]|jgi:ribosomal protein L7Ae-like RNA K-turn-binding protein